MVGPVSRGRTDGVIFIFALVLGAHEAAASEADVTVSCPELSAEDRAQVEARVRASLLSASRSPASVELSCDVAAAQSQVTGNGHQVTLRTDRSASAVKEVLLASAENAILAWSAELASGPEDSTLPPPAPPPAAEPVAAPQPASVPAVAPTPEPNRVPDTQPTAHSRPASTWLFAGPRVELWSGGSGLGGQLGLQQKFGSAFVAGHGGYLLNLPPSSQFSAHELQFGAQIGWQPQSLFGLRGALGVGVSVFGATPAAGVSAQGGSTSSTLLCLSVELSRPVEFGALALLPAAGLRGFTRSRSVLVDGEQVLALPALTLEASLNLALKVGG
jgi:hypothetical protein